MIGAKWQDAAALGDQVAFEGHETRLDLVATPGPTNE
jgi:hypothetical protein